MTAEQVVRAAIIRPIDCYTYRELAFHPSNVRVYRQFYKISIGKAFKKSTLQQEIKALSDETWEQINGIVLDYAKYDQDIEKGWKIRVDYTVVESNIPDPYDSELFVDANRVLNRILATAKEELSGISFFFTHHLRRAKHRNFEIMNVKNADLTQKLHDFLPIARQVVCQTRHQVIAGESVSAQEKVVSIFEEHINIIRKDRRDTYYRHKIYITSGSSNLILGCVVLESNLADSELTGMMLDRQEDIYSHPPLGGDI